MITNQASVESTSTSWRCGQVGRFRMAAVYQPERPKRLFKANTGNCEEFPLPGSLQRRYLESVTPKAGQHAPEDDAMEG